MKALTVAVVALGICSAAQCADGKLDEDIAKAKLQLRQVRASRAQVKMARKRFVKWVGTWKREMAVQHAREMAKLTDAARTRAKLERSGRSQTRVAIFNGRGRLVGVGASVNYNSGDAAAGALLGKRVTDSAANAYAHWNESIGRNVSAARNRLQEYDSMVARLGREYGRLNGLIKAAERAVGQFKLADNAPVPKLQIPGGVVLAMNLDDGLVKKSAGVVVISDLSGHGNHAQASGAQIDANGKVGRCLKFSLPSPHLTTMLSQEKSKTVAMWVKIDSFATNILLAHGYNDAVGFRFMILDDSTAFLRVGRVAGPKHHDKRFPHPLRSNTWHHMAIIVDPEIAGFAMYVDGTLRYKDGLPNDCAFRGRALQILNGREHSMSGSIDELAVFNRPLNDAEVMQLYRLGEDGKGLAE